MIRFFLYITLAILSFGISNDLSAETLIVPSGTTTVMPFQRQACEANLKDSKLVQYCELETFSNCANNTKSDLPQDKIITQSDYEQQVLIKCDVP